MQPSRQLDDELLYVTDRYLQGLRQKDGPSLEDLVRAYPQFAAELAEFAATQFSLDDMDFVEGAGSGDLDLTAERGILTAAFAGPTQAAAFPGLAARARELNLPLPRLAAALDLGVDVVASLDQRLIVAASIPARLLRRLAELLQTSTLDLQGFLQAPPASAAAHFYADRPPVTGVQQSFRAAVRGSRLMSEAQRAQWLSADGDAADTPGRA